MMSYCLQAILRIDSSAFFMIEGTGQASRFPGMAWGNGFVTNASLIQHYNLSDPTAFFDNLLEVPELLNRTIIASHVYGPNVTVGRDRQPNVSRLQGQDCEGPSIQEFYLLHCVHSLRARHRHSVVQRIGLVGTSSWLQALTNVYRTACRLYLT